MALTVEELQIVLSCDATTAQAVLEKMDATVKAYTQKFQSYFDNTNKGKTTKVSGLDAVAKNVEKQTKKLAKAGSDWKKQYEQTFGETFESSMMKAKIRSSAEHGTGEYIPSGKKYVGGDENGRGGGMGDPNLYSKSIVEYRRQIEGVAQAANEASTATGRMLAPTFGETFKATLASLPDLINSFVMRSTDALSKVGSVIGKTFAVGAKVAIGAIRMIGTVAKITARAIGTAFKVAGGLIRGIVGAAQKVGSSIKKAFNNTLLGKFVKRLGTVMMRMAAMKLIRGTIDGVKKGLEELAKTSGSSAKAMNSIKAAGGSIKMALGAAVMPIVKALVPVFVEIAGVVNSAANAIARFFAVLTGQGQYTAVSFSSDLDGISESASGAGSAVKGMLADFDELNVLQKNSGGGGGGSSGVEQSLSTVADQNAFSELGEIIRNSILHGDWSGAATAITDKLNALIRDIPWGDIGTRIGTYLDGALEFLATAITTFDWNGLGASLAEACNASIVRVNWANLGTVLSGKFSIVIRSLGSFLENLNFSELADGFSKFAIGFFDGITNAIESVDWKKIGENVKTFLKNVNWSGIADSIMEGIGAALGGLAALIWGLIEEAWDNVVKWWKDVAYEDGQFTISGLLDGIVKALSSIGTWIKKHIFNPIIKGFKKAFGIASPAKKMNEPGQMVGEGILEGIAKPFKSIGKWINEHIIQPIKKWFSEHSVVDTIEIGVGLLKEGWKTVSEWVKTSIGPKVEKGIGLLRDGFTTVYQWIKDKFFGGTVWKGVSLNRDGFTTVWQWIKDRFFGGTVWKGVSLSRDGFTTIANWITKSYLGIAVSKGIGVIRSGWTTIANWINSSYLGIAVNKGIGVIRNGWTTIKAWIDKSYIGEALNKAVGLVRAGWNTVASWITGSWLGGTVSKGISLTVNLANKAYEAFVKGWNALSNKALSLKVSIADNIRSAWNKAAKKWNNSFLGKTLGKLPTLASGGVAYGPTMAVLGEYAGAKNNPEVIAPLNKLQGILERTNTGNSNGMTKEQANTMIGLLKELTKKETVVRPSVELGQVVDRSLKAYART